jgi:YidC/Oxa1 family membrane protein insertase
VFEVIANLLAWFYQITHSYAGAIALLTVVIMVLLTPLTLKGTKSMLAMQTLQPEIKRLQAEHKGDRQKANEEMMKLYQEHKINPIGGCLPLLLQAPVFIILFRVLHKLTETCTVANVQKYRSEGFCTKEGLFFPKYVSRSSELFKSLIDKTEMKSIGLDLSKAAGRLLVDDWVKGIPYLLLVLVVVATSYYQQKQIMARTKNQANATPANQQQQMLLKIMPLFTGVFSLTLPSGMIIYFLTTNFFRIGQNAYITRRFYRQEHEHAAAAAEAASTPPSKDRGGSAKTPPSSKPAPNGKPTSKPAPNRPAPSGKRPTGRVTPPKATPGRPRPTPRPAPKKK